MSFGQFLELLLSLSLQVALLVIIARWLCRHTNRETTRCEIWGAVFLLTLLITALALNLPHLRLWTPWSAVSPEIAIRFSRIFEATGLSILILWGLGFIVSLGITIVGMFTTTRFLKACLPIQGRLGNLARELASSGLIAGKQRTGPIQLLWRPGLTSPFCWQFHQPHIVLPEFMLDLDEQAIKLVVRHELEHLQQGHPLQLLMQRLTESLFWFHPSVWYASQQIALSREFLCDDAAIAGEGDTVVYLKILVEIIERTIEHDEIPSEVLTLKNRQSDGVLRIQRLIAKVNQSEPAFKCRIIPQPVLCLTLCGLLCSQLWLPVNVLASSGSIWSPWPRWSADVLHDFDIHVRDYELPGQRSNLHELQELQENREH